METTHTHTLRRHTPGRADRETDTKPTHGTGPNRAHERKPRKPQGRTDRPNTENKGVRMSSTYFLRYTDHTDPPTPLVFYVYRQMNDCGIIQSYPAYRDRTPDAQNRPHICTHGICGTRTVSTHTRRKPSEERTILVTWHTPYWPALPLSPLCVSRQRPPVFSASWPAQTAGVACRHMHGPAAWGVMAKARRSRSSTAGLVNR